MKTPIYFDLIDKLRILFEGVSQHDISHIDVYYLEDAPSQEEPHQLDE